MKKVTELNSYNAVPRKGVSWRAVFAGTISVFSVMLILNLVGLAIGLGSIEPTEETDPLSGLGTGTLIWWILSSLFALFIGAYVAARVGVSFSTKSGIVQGIMTWALTTLFSIWLITSAIGSILSGVGNVVGSVLSTTGNVIQEQVGPVIKDQMEDLDISLDQAKEEFYGLLEDTQKEELDPDELEARAQEVTSEARSRGESAARRPQRADAEVERVFNEARDEFEGTFEAVDKQALVNILVERTNMSEREAGETVDNYLAAYEDLRERSEQFLERTKEEANQQAEIAANAVSDAAFYLAISLVLGVIVAALGGYVGVRNLRRDYARTDYIIRDEDRYTRHDVR